MSEVEFNLINSSDLSRMAPPALGGGQFGNAVLPANLNGQGIYIIFNQNTDNRYIGISTNLYNRFNTRLASVVELGFSDFQMQQVVIFWGFVRVKDTPNPLVWRPIQNYSAPFEVIIDGTQINLEKLLIRFILTQARFGGTVSNAMMAFQPYYNPTPNIVNVTLHYGWGSVASQWGVNARW